jgi:hypothetical protein
LGWSNLLVVTVVAGGVTVVVTVVAIQGGLLAMVMHGATTPRIHAAAREAMMTAVEGVTGEATMTAAEGAMEGVTGEATTVETGETTTVETVETEGDVAVERMVGVVEGVSMCPLALTSLSRQPRMHGEAVRRLMRLMAT